MMSILTGAVSADSFLTVLLCLFLLAYFVYKEWPEFKKRISHDAESQEEVHTVEGRLAKVEKQISDITDALSRDYSRLNIIDKLTKANAKAAKDSLAERQIIMESLLACLKGLHELGANGPTEEGINKINSYLNKQAHINQEILGDLEE